MWRWNIEFVFPERKFSIENIKFSYNKNGNQIKGIRKDKISTKNQRLFFEWVSNPSKVLAINLYQVETEEKWTLKNVYLQKHQIVNDEIILDLMGTTIYLRD